MSDLCVCLVLVMCCCCWWWWFVCLFGFCLFLLLFLCFVLFFWFFVLSSQPHGLPLTGTYQISTSVLQPLVLPLHPGLAYFLPCREEAMLNPSMQKCCREILPQSQRTLGNLFLLLLRGTYLTEHLLG